VSFRGARVIQSAKHASGATKLRFAISALARHVDSKSAFAPLRLELLSVAALGTLNDEDADAITIIIFTAKGCLLAVKLCRQAELPPPNKGALFAFNNVDLEGREPLEIFPRMADVSATRNGTT
jgi:hypothetical protein